MEQGVVDSPVILVIKAPNQKYNDQTINCFQNWTVEKLKAHLSDVYPSKPSSKDQRLVYSGKLLLDHFTLKDVLRKHDEYHMLHLVCASRTPPGSPKSHGSSVNKSPEGPSVGPATSQNPGSASASQNSHSSSPGESGDGLRHRAGPYPYYPMHHAFMHGYSWNQHVPQPAPLTNVTTAATYPPMTLMWWQQLYAQQYYMHYQAWAASTQHLRPEQASAQSHRSSSLPNQPLAEERRGNAQQVQMNAQGGEVLNEDEQNGDWLDWAYTVARAAILLSIVYFYSTFSRFLLVFVALLGFYLGQAGWFQNEVRLPGDDVEGELHNPDLQEMERVMDEGLDDDGESGEEGAEDPNGVPQAGFLSSTWSFIITFFMSLIPEGPPNAAN